MSFLCGKNLSALCKGPNPISIARYTLAVNRRYSKENEPSADFINCVAFGSYAEFAEKYFKKGLQVIISGRIQTGSYTNKDGQRIYTTDVVIEEQNFAESKASFEGKYAPNPSSAPPNENDFMDIPPDVDSEVPFN